MVTLTAEERKKFVEWLRQEIAGDEILMRQMEKMPGLEPLAKARRTEIVAKAIVAKILDGITEETIE